MPADGVMILFACQPRTVRTMGKTVFTSHPDARLVRMNDAAIFSSTQDEVRALVDRVGHLDAEAHAAAEAGLWTAAVLLLAASAEAMLLATVAVFEPDLRDQPAWQVGRVLKRWSLGELVDVAIESGWLPVTGSERGPLTSLSGDVGDAMTFVSEVRKMAVHPGAWVRETPRLDFDDADEMRQTFAVVDGIVGTVRDQMHAVLMQF